MIMTVRRRRLVPISAVLIKFVIYGVMEVVKVCFIIKKKSYNYFNRIICALRLYFIFSLRLRYSDVVTLLLRHCYFAATRF